MNCVDCKNPVCGFQGKTPQGPSCPMNDTELFAQARELYKEEQNARFYDVKHGPRRGSRVDATIDLMNEIGVKKVGVVFCSMLTREGKLADTTFKKAGFETVSVCCKAGGYSFEELSRFPRTPEEIAKEADAPWNRTPSGEKKYRAVCDPIGQALCMNKEKTDFNVLIGLCVGHDSLFIKYSEALCSVLIAKDGLFRHAPCNDLYARERFGLLD